MMSVYIYTLLTLVTYEGWIYAYNLNDTKRLYANLMTDYDNTIRPIWNQTQPIKVIASFSLLSIIYFDEVHQKFLTTGHLHVVWNDELLQWNESKYGGIQSFMYPQDKLWRPLVGLSSAVNEFKIVGDGQVSLFVRSDGSVIWSPSDFFVSTCKADITYYPFDSHMCSIVFTALNGDKASIYVTLFIQTVDLSQYESNGEWDIVSTKAAITQMGDFDKGIVFQKWVFTIAMKRKPLFFVFHFICPIFFISLMNASVGMLPSDSGEKVSFSVTVFLGFMVFIGVFSGSVPETSDSLAYISIILDLLMASSTLSVFFTVISLNFGLRSNDNPVTKRIAKFSRMVQRLRRSNRKENGSDLAIPKIKENKVDSIKKTTGVQENSNEYLENEIPLTWKMASEAMEYVMFRILFFFNLGVYIFAFSIFTNHLIFNY